MPYRHAHWWLIALFPVIGLAFWPGYFGVIRSAPFAFHVHGISAALWIVLTAFQSWTIATRRNALHRSAGLGLFVLVPVFVAGGLLTLWRSAALFHANSDPFHGRYAARLAPDDMLAIIVFLWLVHEALAQRRSVHRHASHMLATVMLVLPPALGRVLPGLPGAPHTFEFGFYAGELVATMLAGWLWLRDRRYGAPFLIVAICNLIQCMLFPTIAATATWGRIYGDMRLLPPLPLVAAGMAAGAAVLWHGWRGARPIMRRLPA